MLKMVSKVKQLAKKLPTLNVNAKNFDWTQRKKIYFFQF